MSDAAHRPPVLALVRDLIFASRITATASASNVTVQLIRDPADLGRRPGRRLLVDLNLPGAIAAAAEWSRATGGDVAGFVSHVDTATIAQARAAGIHKVLARSRFVEVLLSLLGDDAAGADVAGQ
jgi:hypothetical protein